MLELFQIKDLHEDPSQSPTRDADPPRGRRGIIQLSAADYDDIATNHPRSRLMYMDDDDGEVITVGSSLELSQRLEDPISLEAFPLADISENISTTYPMHIFDIRRSKSVTDLWKRYEYQPHTPIDRNIDTVGSTPEAQRSSHVNPEQNGSSGQDRAEPSTPTTPPVAAPAPAPADREMEPLLAAFEEQMASILRASEDLNRANEQPDTSRVPPTQETPQTNSTQGRNDAFTTAVHNLIDGAEKIRSGVMSRLPEFERQLQNAQRALPEPVGSSVQATLVALEDQARHLASALNNAANTRGPRGGNIFQGDLPTATETVSGLRNLASEIGYMGQTLFQAFESEFRCNTNTQGQRATGDASISPSQQDAGSVPASGTDVPPLQTPSLETSPAQNSNSETHVQSGPSQPAPLVQEEQAQPSLLDNQHPSSVPSEPYLAICPPRPSPGPGATLFVGNVGFGAHDGMIRDVFSSKGFHPRVSLLRYPGAQQHAGFGYAYFNSIEEAKDALEAVQGTHIDGHAINLEFSDLPPVPQSPYPTVPTVERSYTTEQAPNSNNNRRSALSVADLCSNDNQRSANVTSSHDSLSSSQVDSQRFNMLYPSLLPESTPQGTTTSSSREILPDQASRFPPVSQLDAHFSSERARSLLNNPPAQQEISANQNLDSGQLYGLPGCYPSAPEVDHGSRQEPAAGPRPWDLGNIGYPGYGGPCRRRSIPPSHTWRGNGHFPQGRPLRRQHTERHHGRNRWPGAYELPAYTHHAATLVPATEHGPQQTSSGQQTIDQCVSTLASLGYGSAEEGGLSRIAVYAAAVDGRVLDAIEMIEEDRKACEQQSDHRATQ